MSTDRIKRAIQAGWDGRANDYQADTRISLNDVHYGPLSPGERELQVLGDVRGSRVLELACGAAQNSIVLAKWGARVTAMDISSRQLAWARGLIEKERVDVSLLRGDMERLGMFRSGVFDVVLSSFGWDHVPDLETCVNECHRVLNDSGLLVVCTGHPLAAFEWDEDEKAVLVTDYFNPPVDSEEPSPWNLVFFHTVEEMFGLLTSRGFRVERVLEPYPYPVDMMSDGEKQAVPYISPHWERQYQRFRRVPFTIIYVARKP